MNDQRIKEHSLSIGCGKPKLFYVVHVFGLLGTMIEISKLDLLDKEFHAMHLLDQNRS